MCSTGQQHEGHKFNVVQLISDVETHSEEL